MSDLPEGWGTYDPNDHELSTDPAYQRARGAAADRARQRRGTYGQALAALRRARSLTQVAVAEQLGVAQGEVSRIEHQADLLLSTLSRYVEAAGGQLAMVVSFATGEPAEVVVDLLDVLSEEQIVAAVPSNLATVTVLAGFLGRYDEQEARFRAAASA